MSQSLALPVIKWSRSVHNNPHTTLLRAHVPRPPARPPALICSAVLCRAQHHHHHAARACVLARARSPQLPSAMRLMRSGARSRRTPPGTA